MTTLVRPATASDAPRLTRLAIETFRETYETQNTPEDMARYVAGHFTPERQAAEIADPDGIVLVAEHGGELVGYVHMATGPAPESVTGEAPIEIKRFYVASAWHGQGIAQAMMASAFEAARARGARTIWLGVWERNPRAAAFYRKSGFTKVGEQVFMLGADAQTDWVLSRSLG